MIEVNEISGIQIAKFVDQDRFNSLISEPVKEKLLDYYNKPNTKLILNLEGIKFIDSSGFSVFLSLMKAANNKYGEFKICNINPDVKELFKILQLHNVFEIHDSQQDCLNSFS